MKHLKTTFVIAAMIAISCKKNDNNPTPTIIGKDLSFMIMAINANMAEVDLGQLASQRGSAQGVKNFGNQMASEHTETRNDLEAIRTNEHLYISPQIDAKHVQMRAQLSTLSGYSFDTLYIHGQLKDHQQTAALYQSELDSGQNTTVKNHAAKYLPHIKMHLAKADSLLKALTH
jgi:putative membrane protein